MVTPTLGLGCAIRLITFLACVFESAAGRGYRVDLISSVFGLAGMRLLAL